MCREKRKEGVTTREYLFHTYIKKAKEKEKERGKLACAVDSPHRSIYMKEREREGRELRGFSSFLCLLFFFFAFLLLYPFSGPPFAPPPPLVFTVAYRKRDGSPHTRNDERTAYR